VLPERAEVGCTADIRLWAPIVDVREDGSVGYLPSAVGDALDVAAYRLIAETGQVPAELPRELVKAVLVRLAADRVAREEATAADRVARDAAEEAHVASWLALPDADFDESYDRYVCDNGASEMCAPGLANLRPYNQTASLKARIEATRATRDASIATAKRAADIERDSWINAHGSTRLRKALALGLAGSEQAIYEEERLAVERPGWRCELVREERATAIAPTEEALDALTAARQVDPDCQLVWLKSRDSGGCEAVAGEHLGNLVVCEIEGGRDTRHDADEEE
jgi:hypothetical protein